MCKYIVCMCGAYMYMNDGVHMPQCDHELKGQLEILWLSFSLAETASFGCFSATTSG